jgi:hypothetical protein
MTRSRNDATIWDIAGWLLAEESASKGTSGEEASTASRVSAKLRTPISALVGVAGYESILTRALTLAQHETHVLRAVSVANDGLLQGFDHEGTDAGKLLIFHLIDLLVTFTGADFTLRLLQDAWPNLPDFDIGQLGKKWA